MPRAHLVQPVFQRLACWSSASRSWCSWHLCRPVVQVMRTTSRNVSLVIHKACARDGSLRPVSCNKTSLKQVFVLGALVPAMLLATVVVGSASIDDGWGGQSDHSGKIAPQTHSLSNFKHVVGFQCHDISFECCLQLCWFQTHLTKRTFDKFECGAR